MRKFLILIFLFISSSVFSQVTPTNTPTRTITPTPTYTFGPIVSEDGTTGNSKLGVKAFEHISGGTHNFFAGWMCGNSAIVSQQNVAIGYGAFSSAISGEKNVAIGWKAMGSALYATQNIAIGPEALENIFAGIENIGIGWQAGENIYTGIENILIGHWVGQHLTTGSSNIGIGLAFLINATGNHNIAIGTHSLAQLTTGSGNIAIGFDSGLWQGNVNNKLIIDNQYRARPLIFGDFTSKSVTFDVPGGITANGPISSSAGWTGTYLVNRSRTVTVVGGLIVGVSP